MLKPSIYGKNFLRIEKAVNMFLIPEKCFSKNEKLMSRISKIQDYNMKRLI